MLDQGKAEHNAVRSFVEGATGGFVSKIVGESTSEYKATKDSLEKVEGKTPQGVFLYRAAHQDRIKPYAEFIPVFYECAYTVEVVYPPGDKTETLTVVDAGEKFLISRRLMTLHHAQQASKYWTYREE